MDSRRGDWDDEGDDEGDDDDDNDDADIDACCTRFTSTFTSDAFCTDFTDDVNDVDDVDATPTFFTNNNNTADGFPGRNAPLRPRRYESNDKKGDPKLCDSTRANCVISRGDPTNYVTLPAISHW